MRVELGGIEAKPLGQWGWEVTGALFELVGGFAELAGVVFGPGDVGAGGHAVIEAGEGWWPVWWQRGVGFVDTHQQGVGVVVDGEVVVGQQVASLFRGDDLAGEGGGACGGVDRPAGRGARDASAARQILMEGGEGLYGGAGCFDVEKVVDAVTAAG
ncbi:hypothetical protein [Streptomyces hawaiiensis]|uniref:hypothetical protein n=1 Tax=Streptomyces hawaiiensis TaxID=67305 RepID=UPI00364EDE33